MLKELSRYYASANASVDYYTSLHQTWLEEQVYDDLLLRQCALRIPDKETIKAMQYGASVLIPNLNNILLTKDLEQVKAAIEKDWDKILSFWDDKMCSHSHFTKP